MKCETARENIEAHFDALLRGAIDGASAEHLRSCEACSDRFEQLDRLISGLKALRVESEVAPAISTSAPSSRSRFRAVLNIAAGLALVAGAMIGGKAILTSQPEATMHSVTQPSLQTVSVGIRLRGQSADDLIAVKKETAEPRVHLFMLHSVTPHPEEDASDSSLGETDSNVRTAAALERHGCREFARHIATRAKL